MMHDYGYKHTLRICNTYCSSVATMVTRTHLSLAFIVRTLPVLYLYMFYCMSRGYVVVQLVEALRYRPEGPGFDS